MGVCAGALYSCDTLNQWASQAVVPLRTLHVVLPTIQSRAFPMLFNMKTLYSAGATYTASSLNQTKQVVSEASDMALTIGKQQVLWGVTRLAEHTPIESYLDPYMKRIEITEQMVDDACACYNTPLLTRYREQLSTASPFFGEDPWTPWDKSTPHIDPRHCALVPLNNWKKDMTADMYQNNLCNDPLKGPKLRAEVRRELEKFAPYRSIQQTDVVNYFVKTLNTDDYRSEFLSRVLDDLKSVSRTAVREDHSNITPLVILYFSLLLGQYIPVKKKITQSLAGPLAKAFLDDKLIFYLSTLPVGFFFQWSPLMYLKLLAAGYFTRRLQKHREAQTQLQNMGIQTKLQYASDMLRFLAIIYSADEIGNHAWISSCLSRAKVTLMPSDAHPADYHTYFGTSIYTGNTGIYLFAIKLLRCALCNAEFFKFVSTKELTLGLGSLLLYRSV